MKLKTTIALTSFAITFLSASLYAQEKPEASMKPETTEQTQEQTVSLKNFDLSIKYSYGMSHTTGDIAGDGGQKSITGESGSYGIHFGYNLYKILWLYLQLSQNTYEYIAEYNYLSETQRQQINGRFFDIMLSTRIIYSLCYFDLGYYYGKPYGSWYKTVSHQDTSVTETAIYGSKKKNDHGLALGLGVLLPVTDALFLQLGPAMKTSFAPSYEANGDSLKRNSLEFVAGIQYRF